MKVSTEQIFHGEDEICIRYQQLTPEITELIQLLQKGFPSILGKRDNEQFRLSPQDIYYFECVDEKLFAYTRSLDYQIFMTLAEVEEKLDHFGFFRCNKSFVLNINKVASVKSELGNRINATLDNDEHVIISRHYASGFRELLSRNDFGR